MNAGTFFAYLQLPIHNGEILGPLGPILVCITAFAPITLMITGVIHWLKKRRSRKLHDLKLCGAFR
jgi:uncharacterized iron-regulated membrane protein